MKKLFSLAAAVFVALALTGCGFGFIKTGEVGVRTAFGKIDQQAVPEGFYTAFLSSVDEYTAKETSVDLDKLTPRAKDNLTLKDLDVTIYYKVNGGKIASFASTHSGMSARLERDDFYRAGYRLIENLARGVSYDAVSKYDSLTLHQNRQALEESIKTGLQGVLNADTPGMFEITRIVVRSIQTDPAVEESIRKSIAVQKDLEVATKQVQVKQQEAFANEKLGQSLTPAVLQSQYIKAIDKCAERQGCTLIVGGGTNPQFNLPK